jgi:hypothetical protein
METTSDRPPKVPADPLPDGLPFAVDGDEVPPGTQGSGEAVCRDCGGRGRLDGGTVCPACRGTGKVVVGIGGG